MRKTKEIAMGFLFITIIGFIGYSVFQYNKKRTNRELARRIAEISPRGGPPETIEGLRQAIALYEAQIERNVREGAQTGVYWKILAIRLADRGMHNDALDALERAIYYNSEDPALFYSAGISAGIAAKSIVGFSPNAVSEREHYYRLSENAYLRAFELDNAYTKPLYGLGVLYVFELNRPAEAIPHLERSLSIQGSDINTMFVLARAYAMTGSYSQAIELYERIISRSRDRQIQAEALNNIDTIQRLIYE